MRRSSLIITFVLLLSAALLAQRQQIDYFEGTSHVAQKGQVDQEELKEGLWKYYYLNEVSHPIADSTVEKNLLAQGYYNAGKRTGKWFFYYPNGKISRIENCLDGKTAGMFQFYTEEGKKIALGTYAPTAIPSLDYINFGWNPADLHAYFDTLSSLLKEGKWIHYSGLGVKSEEGYYQSDKKEGEWIVYNYGGFQVAAKGKYLNGKKEGKWIYEDSPSKKKITFKQDIIQQEITFHPNDTSIQSVQNYISDNNRTIHLQTNYYPDGKVESQKQWNDKYRHGLWQYYYENGQLKMKLYYKENRLDSTCLSYYPTGILASQLKFEGGVRVDSAFYYYENKKLKAIGKYRKVPHTNFNFFSVDVASDRTWNRLNQFNIYEIPSYVLDGDWKVFDPTGRLTNTASYKNGKPDGVIKSYVYGKDTVLCNQVTFDKGMKNGWEYIYHYHNKHLYTKVFYKNDKKEGLEVIYNFDGSKYSETQYRNGKKNGFEKIYSVEGYLLTKTPYKDGLKEGTALSYHTNTRLLQSAISYTQGVKNGTALYYDRMGKLNERASYKYDLKQGLYFNLHYSFAIDSTYYLNGYEKAFFEEIQTNDSIATILLDKNFDLVKTTNKLEKKCAYDDSLKILQCLFFDQWEHLNRIETYNIETEITTVEIYKNKGKRLDEYNLVNSKKEKIFFGLKYHKNGRIRKISSFQDGLVHGQVTTYYDNGTFKTNKIYTAGKKNGRYITYYPDGKLKTTGYYLHGEKHNDWSYFNTDGSLNYTVTYKAMSNHSYEEESNYFTQNNIQPPPEGYELKSIFRKLLSPPPPPPAPKFIEEDWD